MYYTNYFFICSILGFLLETCFYTLFKWDGGSGILYGPWTPVYGIGAIIIIIFFDFIFKIPKIITYILIILIVIDTFFTIFNKVK